MNSSNKVISKNKDSRKLQIYASCTSSQGTGKVKERDHGSVMARLSDSSRKACLSPRGSFRLERSVGFGYDLIMGNSRLSSNLSVHFIPEFCTNMYSSLNMKMTDINKPSCGTPLYPCDCGHTFARQPARVIQTILLEENTRK